MFTRILSSNDHFAKLFVFLLPFALALAVPSCGDSNELSREKAIALINASLGYPQHEKVEFQKLYTIDYERIVKWRGAQAAPGICLGSGGPEFSGRNEVTLKQMKDKGLVTINNEQKEGTNCITTFARVDLTDEGRKFILEESENSYTLKASDIVADQVTGIIQIKDTPLATAEYTVSRDQKTPFFMALDVFGRSYTFDTKRATFVLYDDGWRVEK